MIQQQFTDAQGTNYTLAALVCHGTTQQIQNNTINTTSSTDYTTETEVTTNKNYITYSVWYWASITEYNARANGLNHPYALMHPSTMAEVFTFEPTTAQDALATVELKCEDHLQNTLLPEINAVTQPS